MSELELQVLLALAETRARRHCRPQPGIVRANVPGASAAHAEPAIQYAILVDGVLPLHRVQRLEQVHLAGKFAGVAIPPVQVQHDRIARREFAHVAFPIGQKVDLAERLAAPMKPQIQPPAMRRIRRVGRRHHQSVRLHALVDLRNVSAHHQPRRRGPCRMTLGKLTGALFSVRQQRPCLGHLVGIEELVVLQREAHRLAVDLHIRQ